VTTNAAASNVTQAVDLGEYENDMFYLYTRFLFLLSGERFHYGSSGDVLSLKRDSFLYFLFLVTNSYNQQNK
jgi:hypothetical protein